MKIFILFFYAPYWPCCTNRLGDSLRESSMIAEGHEQLGPDEVQDHELVGLQRSTEAAGIADDLVRSRHGLEATAEW